MRVTKFNKIMIGIWCFLAIASFVCAFFCPVLPKIIGIAFGSLNVMTMLVVLISYIQNAVQSIKINKQEDGWV